MTKKSKASSLFVLDGSEEDYAQNYWEDMPEFEQNDLDIYGSMNIAFRTLICALCVMLSPAICKE